jgi:hypothetical protein
MICTYSTPKPDEGLPIDLLGCNQDTPSCFDTRSLLKLVPGRKVFVSVGEIRLAVTSKTGRKSTKVFTPQAFRASKYLGRPGNGS